jgi:hypothetical protein
MLAAISNSLLLQMNIDKKQSVALFMGAGALKNAWRPIIKAIQPPYFKEQLSADGANCGLRGRKGGNALSYPINSALAKWRGDEYILSFCSLLSFSFSRQITPSFRINNALPPHRQCFNVVRHATATVRNSTEEYTIKKTTQTLKWNSI